MTRMEKRRRRRHIARIRAVTVVFTLLAATFAVVAISSTGAADSNLDVEQVTRTLAAEPVLLVAEQEPMTVEDMTLRELPDEPAELAEEADESELIEQALLEQGYLHEENGWNRLGKAVQEDDGRHGRQEVDSEIAYSFWRNVDERYASDSRTRYEEAPFRQPILSPTQRLKSASSREQKRKRNEY